MIMLTDVMHIDNFGCTLFKNQTSLRLSQKLYLKMSPAETSAPVNANCIIRFVWLNNIDSRGGVCFLKDMSVEIGGAIQNFLGCQ